MAFSFGFYNSFNHDRRYNAIQISMIFDGIISDGIYANYEKAMIVKASEEENTVIVQPGRAWFDHTWNYNDADLPIIADQSEIVLDRIDALVIDISSNENYRTNDIIWVKGTPSSNPERPVLTNTLEHHQYPLCYIYRKANTEIINQEDITNTVGTEECPFVTGILDTVSIDELLLQWKDQWAQFMIVYEKSADDWQKEQQDDFKQFYSEFKTQMNAFEQASGKEFTDWFSRLQEILDENTASHLQNEIDEITETEFNRFYGLINSTTDIDDAKNVITTSTSDAVSTTRFQTSDENETITTTIVMNSGNFDYVRTTIIIPTDSGDHIETNYIRRAK
jgi:hypothetical protein